VTQPLVLSLLCPTFQLNDPATLPPADQGSNYSYQTQTIGGIAPFTFAASGLPGGETINTSTGLISGIPTGNGTFSNIQITAHDSCPTAPQPSNETLSQTVNLTLAITTPTTLPAGQVGQGYTTPIVAAGGSTPYTFAQTLGTLPPGVLLNAG